MTELFANRRLGRRKFLRSAGIAGVTLPVAGGLFASACYSDPTGSKAEPGVPAAQVKAPAAAPVGTATSASEHSDQIDADHKKGIEDFLKNQTTPITKGKGNTFLAPRLENGVKVWDLTLDEVDWEVAPGQIEKARGYNQMIPGPILRATEGDRVRINVKNNLTESSTIHWHGLVIPIAMDGVPYVTQDPIKPGGTFVYEFTLRNSGSHMYHSHLNSEDQVNRGLLGAFIVDPKDPSTYPKYDKEYVLIMNDSLLGFTLNGKSFPATDALVAKKGDRVLIRWMNEGMMYHPFHLHGGAMQVFARDGYPVNPPYLCDTLDVPPGNRYDTIIEAKEPGLWAFHCHILTHAESPKGFFGLVTVLVVQE